MLRVLLVAVLVVLAVPAMAGGTTLMWDYTTIGDSTIYTYILFSGFDEDIITSFHIYAPMDYWLVTEWHADEGWSFSATRDEETGGTDLCWYSPDGVAGGLPAGGMLMVGMTTSSSVPTVEDYVVPGYLGNWGYEVAGWPGSVAVMLDSVGVPQSIQAVPEPSSMIVLASGLGGILAARRRRR